LLPSIFLSFFSLSLIISGIMLIKKVDKKSVKIGIVNAILGFILSLFLLLAGSWIVVYSLINTDKRAGLLDAFKYIFGYPSIITSILLGTYFFFCFKKLIKTQKNQYL